VSADPAELRELFHTLNNQLGIILSHGELIEAKAQDPTQKARAEQVVTATLDALTTVRQIRLSLVPEEQSLYSAAPSALLPPTPDDNR
jgi:hypothetical protein